MAMLAGSSFAADSTPPTGQQVELTFDLSKCEPQGPSLYKCPAIDKPLCTKEFQQPNVQCIRIGKGQRVRFHAWLGMD